MPKVLGYVASAKNGGKRIVGRSDADWRFVRPMGLFKFVGSQYVYNIAKAYQSIFTFEFTVDNPHRITINKPIGIDLVQSDEVILFYDEYELMSLIRIVNPGIGYRVGDLIEINGGTPLLDKIDNKLLTTSFEILEVNEIGGISMLGLRSKGKYVEVPPTISTIKSINGQDALLEIKYIKSEDRSYVEQIILAIEREKHIHFDRPLPSGLSKGILSCTKWELLLVTEILDGDVIGGKAEIFNDMTPFIHLPFLIPNCAGRDNIYNQSIKMIDVQFEKLTRRIEELEKKLGQ